MSNINPDAAAARETHRKTDGKFGEQPLAEGELDLAGEPDLAAIQERSRKRSLALARDVHDRTVELNQVCLTEAAALVRQRHPQAAAITLEDNGEGGITWHAHDAGDNPVDLDEDDELQDELWDVATIIDMNYPTALAPMARGYQPNPSYAWPDADIEIDKYSGSVDKITVDIDQMLAAHKE